MEHATLMNPPSDAVAANDTAVLRKDEYRCYQQNTIGTYQEAVRVMQGSRRLRFQYIFVCLVLEMNVRCSPS